MSGESDLVDIGGFVLHETDKAVLFDDGTRKVWLPKSLVEIGSNGTVTMPEWLAMDKGLI